MDTGQILHIVVTVVAILGAGAVALVCDLLKSNNERLRQMNLELRVRREEEQRRTELALEQLKRVQATAERALAAVAAAALPEASPQPRRAIGPIGLTAMIASGGNTEAQPPSPAETPALAESSGTLEQPGATLEEARVLARGLLAADPGQEGSGAPLPGEVPERLEIAAPVPSAPLFESGIAGGVPPSRKDWDTLLRNAARRYGKSTVDIGPARHRGELIPFESLQSNQESFHLPGGFYPFAALAHLLESRAPFRGMVISFAVNGIRETCAEDGEPDPDTLADAVEAWAPTILAPSEFACPTSRGRFAIVTPDRDGAAQRRFDELTGKLWNFQLRRLATGSEMFCCGGFEANGETLAQAVDAATAHMEANRNGQAPPLLETVRRRLAV